LDAIFEEMNQSALEHAACQNFKYGREIEFQNGFTQPDYYGPPLLSF
jgi:hypothetical protein